MIAVEAIGDGRAPRHRPVHEAARPIAPRSTRSIKDAGLSPLHNVRQVIEVEAIPVLGTGKTDYRALKASYPWQPGA